MERIYDLVRSSNIGKDSLKITLSRMIALVISMVAAMLLSRFRTLEEFGTYSQIYLLATLFSTIILLGVPKSISYFLAKAETDDEKQKFLSLHFLLSTSLSLLTGLVLVATAPLAVRYFDNPMLKSFVFALMLFPWAKTMINSIDAVYIIYNKASRLMIFKIVNSVLLLAIVIVTVLFKLTFLTYMILFVGVQVFFAILVYIIVARLSGRLYLHFDKILTKKILKFSIPIGLSGVLTVLNIQIDKLVIGKFFSTEGLAIYTNAAREMPLTIVGASITVVLLPKLVRLFKNSKKKQAITLWNDSIIISYSFLCFFAVVLIVFAPEIITLLYSAKYLPGVTVFRIYSLLMIFSVTYFGMVLNAIGRTKFILYSTILAFLINAVLNIVFYYLFGFVGPAIATFTSIAVVRFTQLIATSKIISMPLKQLFPWKHLGIITVFNILAGALFYGVKIILPLQLYTGQLAESMIIGTVWLGIYIASIFKLVKSKWDALNSEISIEES